MQKGCGIESKNILMTNTNMRTSPLPACSESRPSLSTSDHRERSMSVSSADCSRRSRPAKSGIYFMETSAVTEHRSSMWQRTGQRLQRTDTVSIQQ
jgi:hypothetical protein